MENPETTTVAMVTCDHCERILPIKEAKPVLISGVQSYNGHLLTNKPETRRVPLCQGCYDNFHAANIEGLKIEDDQEAIDAIASMETLVTVLDQIVQPE